MKKILCLLNLSLLFISGCSCNKNGTYTFTYIEYTEDDELKTTDCSNLEDLRIGIQTICECKNMVMTLEDNYYTFSMKEGHIEDGYFKIVGDKMYLSDSEDGEYKHTGWFHYKNDMIYYGINDTYVVLKK